MLMKDNGNLSRPILSVKIGCSKKNEKRLTGKPDVRTQHILKNLQSRHSVSQCACIEVLLQANPFQTVLRAIEPFFKKYFIAKSSSKTSLAP